MLDIASWPSKTILTNWGRVTHICVGNLIIIGSDNGLSPGRCQAIIWTNAGTLLFGPLGTNFSEILIHNDTFSLKKKSFENVVRKMTAIWSRPQCVNTNIVGIKTYLRGDVCYVCLFVFDSVDKRVVQIKKYSGLKFVNMLGAGAMLQTPPFWICGAFISISFD